MRILALATLLIAASAIPATAEPPPQQAPTVAYVAGDPAYAAPMFTVRMNAAIVSQVDTSSVETSSSTATVVAADSAGNADIERGHGVLFWAALAAIALIIIVFGARWFMKRDEPAYVPNGDDRTRQPGPPGRGRKNE